MAFSKLPPEVARELLRHVKPPKAKITADAQKKSGANKVLLGCVGFISCASLIPYVATQWISNLTDRDDSLTPAQVRRGAFTNSGTRDAGRDPAWDWKNGTYNYTEGFREHLDKQKQGETDLGPDLGPAVREEQKKRFRKADS
jgi:hypothetical protein